MTGPSGSEATKLPIESPTVPHSMCGSGVRWCARADAIFDVPDMHVLEVEVDDQQTRRERLKGDPLGLACGLASCGSYVIDSAPERPRWLPALITGSARRWALPSAHSPPGR